MPINAGNSQHSLKPSIMKKQILSSLLLFILFLASCRKEDRPAPDINPYQMERINMQNFGTLNWKEQQVNIVSGTTIFAEESDLVEIVCGPENTTDPRLIKGCITMNLPTSANPTLRRIRLRKGGYSGTRLADLTELKYSTFVVQNSPTAMVLQVDVNNDNAKDFNIFFNPVQYYQGSRYKPVVLNSWQQWDALHGLWHIEAGNLPEFPNGECTIEELIKIPKYANARILDTPPVGHNGEGVRFTIGGTPRELFDNTIGYFDALIIGTKDRQKSMLFDFTCSN
jgi:hypothetical protein